MTEPKMRDAKNTIESPRLKYPSVAGIGMDIDEVATKTKAIKSDIDARILVLDTPAEAA